MIHAKTRAAALLSLPLALLLLTGCGADGSTGAAPEGQGSVSSAPAAPAATAKKKSRTVEYSVTGRGATSSITYLTLNGGKAGQAQANGKKLPWSKKVKIKDDGLFDTSIFSLVAQAGEGTTKITCKIEADGEVIDKQTSTGPYAVASCSGGAEK